MTEVFQRFATYRSHGTRSSVEIVREGEPLLLNEKYRSADDPWAFLEQLAFAAMDVGRLDIADDCLVLLDQQFPDSPRVTVLKGQRLEADGMLQDALKMYVYYLTKEDENYVPIRKRLITTLRSLGKITEATEELVKYLDIYYADLEGWLELADIYATCNLYDNSLSALAHAQLIAPQTPQIALCSAETAYTTGDIDLALKSFLRAAELCGSGPGIQPGGTETRAWLGVKLVSDGAVSIYCMSFALHGGSFVLHVSQDTWREEEEAWILLTEDHSHVCQMEGLPASVRRDILASVYNDHDRTPAVYICLSKLPSSAKNPKLLEELSTERILAAYSKTDGSAKPNDAGRAAMLRWLGASQTPK
ncbi:TPR-like protein [Rhizoctonia solani]|uniref:ER membrane protein complex subunit 2 n=1 Tax=Rhizoctonia solani TaxID=456999 RepID=A0A8H7HH46_9AGAM|nr:TPR-like protein [Rhizoctonia solani]